ncbi:hypothetical protein RchiOBHm_Chr5g0040201 [Rosa chinensis]|uniref:Uncharacterized protein n=1 Tax=Rosa chinensis TaxID=74649 RepID=A0A2P6QCI3_ROSCH|nr:hypothetical protein RchiOBHm_Chr5g0040201 [Rosa chinensis]
MKLTIQIGLYKRKILVYVDVCHTSSVLNGPSCSARVSRWPLVFDKISKTMAIASIFLFSSASSVDLGHTDDRVFLLFLLFFGFGGGLMDPCLDLSLGLDVLGDGGTEDFRIDPWRWRGFLSSAIHVVGDEAINLGRRPGFLSSDARVGCWVAGRSGRCKIDCRSGQVGGNGFDGGSHGDLVASIAAQYGPGFNWVLWEELHGDFSPMLNGGEGEGCGCSDGGDRSC